jgi:hypothetical protein
MRAPIGIDRKIKRTWLDTAVDHLPETRRDSELRAILDAQLQDELPGPASRAKTLSIILRIWGCVPARCVALKRDALELVPQITAEERIWLHWGMAVIAYPFFRDVAEVVGSLLAASDEIATAQVEARLHRRWGDWPRTTEATRRLLHTLVDWGALGASKRRGHYLTNGKLKTSSTALELWLVEALLRARPSAEVETSQLGRLPEAFPFGLKVKIAALDNHSRFTVYRRESETDVVSIESQTELNLFRTADRRRRGTPKIGVHRQTGRATQSAECHELMRKGLFADCIARAQALIGATVEEAWDARLNPSRGQVGAFRENLRFLGAIGAVPVELKNRLDLLWIVRNDYLDLSSTDEIGRQKLYEIAEKTVKMLIELEQVLGRGRHRAANC